MLLLPTDQTNQEKFAISAATVALHNFQWRYATLILFNSTLINSIGVFIRSYQKNVIIGRGTYYPNFVKKTRQYIIFGADLPDIVHMLIWMEKHQFDNTGTYIVVCQSEQLDKCNEVDIVNTFWNYKIVNVVLINNCKEKTNGFVYYQPEDCKTARPISLQNWDSCLLNNCEHCQNMYPLKLKNLHRCPIIVSTFNQIPYMNLNNSTPTGADGDLLRVIAKAMNFSLVLITPRIGVGWGNIEDNGTWSGSLADVYNEWANFSMTSASITLTRYTSFQISTDYSVYILAWVTHPSELEPSSLKLLRPFQPYVRIALSVSFLMVVLLKILLRSEFLLSLGHELRVRFNYDIVFHLWELCMGLPLSSYPTNKALYYLVTFWMWYCLLIRTFYQVSLINSLQTDVFAPEFDTIEEFVAAKYTFGGGIALREYYIDSAVIYNEWKNVESNDILPVMAKLSQGLKFVLAMNIETTKMFLNSNPDKKLHILPKVILTTPTAIFFKKYSPLANSLNVILSRLRESGIIQKIYMNNTGNKVLKEAQNNYIPISMVHYTGCYAILIIGWLLSGLCFLVERLMNQIKRKLIKHAVIKTKHKIKNAKAGRRFLKSAHE